MGLLLHILEEGTAQKLVSYLLGALSFLVLLLSQLTEVACAVQSHTILVAIDAQKEVGVGDSQMHVDQTVWQPSPQWDNSEEYGDSWLISNRELSTKNGVGWCLKQGMSEKMIPKDFIGK